MQFLRLDSALDRLACTTALQAPGRPRRRFPTPRFTDCDQNGSQARFLLANQIGYQRIADEYNMSVAEVKAFFQRREEVLPFINELLNEKILKFLHAEANFVPVSARAENNDTSDAETEEAEEKTDNTETSGE